MVGREYPDESGELPDLSGVADPPIAGVTRLRPIHIGPDDTRDLPTPGVAAGPEADSVQLTDENQASADGSGWTPAALYIPATQAERRADITAPIKINRGPLDRVRDVDHRRGPRLETVRQSRPEMPGRAYVPLVRLEHGRDLGDDRYVCWHLEHAPAVVNDLVVDPGLMRKILEMAKVNRLDLGFHMSQDARYQQKDARFEIFYTEQPDQGAAELSLDRNVLSREIIHSDRTDEPMDQAWARKISLCISAAAYSMGVRSPDKHSEDGARPLPKHLLQGLTHMPSVGRYIVMQDPQHQVVKPRQQVPTWRVEYS